MLRTYLMLVLCLGVVALTSASDDASSQSEQPRSFHDFSLEEKNSAMKRLALKIDADQDGFLTQVELEKWIRDIHNASVEKQLQHRFSHIDLDQDMRVSWEEYRSRSFAILEDGMLDESQYPADQLEDMRRALTSDEVRFKVADGDADGWLSVGEFRAFLVPELFPHMHHHVVEETITDLDADGDGQLSVDEYLAAHIRNSHADEAVSSREYEYFFSHRDANKDGMLDREEVKDWVLPSHFDPAKAEAVHLVNECDSDGDEKLSLEEVLDNLNLFISSGATSYGQQLESLHEEL